MKSSKLPLSVQVLLIPAALLITIIFVFIFALRIGLTQISEKREALALATKNENILSQKEDLLSNIGANIAANTNLTVTALPSRNPVLVEISQIKNLAIANMIQVSNIKVSSQASQADISGAEVTFDTDGQIAPLIVFVSALKKMAPITHVSKVSLDFSATAVKGTISVKTLWAPLPTKIPAMLQPVAGLNQAEKDLLASLADLTLPKFGTLAPATPLERTNPFAD